MMQGTQKEYPTDRYSTHTHIEFFILSNHYRGSSSLAEINGHICGLRLKSLVLLFYQDAQIQYFLLGMLILAGGP